MTKPRVDIAVSASDILGEVPLWCARSRRLWWIDVRRPSLQSYDPSTGEHQVFVVPVPVIGSFALRAGGGFVLAANDGLYAFTPREALLPLLPHHDHPQNRFNDGKCDRLGRFWVGTMNNTPGNPDGSLYRVDPDLSIHPMFDGVYCPNSLAFGPDDTVLYYADTKLRMIWAFDYDLASGTISNRRLLSDLTNGPGAPDGSTVDADGCLWNAEYGAGRLVRYAPDGRVDRVVELPASQPTSCAFGGADLSTLFVTTAAQNLPARRRREEPHAGALLMLDVGVKGVQEPLFTG